MSDPAIIWAIGFLITALIFFIFELFIPSGGVLGVVSLLAVIAADVSLFFYSSTAGLIGVLLTLVVVPLAVAAGLSIFPKTWIGRRLILADQQDPHAVQYEKSRDAAPARLIGQRGVAVSGLRPVGTCRIGSDRMECLSVQGAIEPGQAVEVVSVNGIEIRVKLVND